MPATTYSEALEALHALAGKVRVDEDDVAHGDPGLAAQRQVEGAALDAVGDFVSNHHDTLDELAPPLAGVEWPEGVLVIGDEPDPSHPLDGIKRLLKMVGDSDMALDEGQRASVRLVEGLVATHHAELADVRVVDVSPAMR